MFKVKFYRTAEGYSDVESFLDELKKSAVKNKNSRVQYKQVALYIQLLQDNGTRLGEKITKHLEEDIWELRPGKNRVLFFYFDKNTFVLLHHFRKKTMKTPRREIVKAKEERDDWISRKGRQQ